MLTNDIRGRLFALSRLTNAFAYYGIVLVTTELFQVDDVCSGKSDSFNVSH